MKTKIFYLLTIFTSSFLYSQSTIVFSAGTTIDVGNGADVCAGTITVSGTPASGGGTFCTGALPVELVSFTASVVKDNVELIWKTATEVNNYGFEIERMTSSQTLTLVGGGQGGGWSKIGFVEGTGTSNAPKEYSYSDKNSISGKYSYRLKQIDRDGKFTYSLSVEVTVVQTPKEFALEQNFPNPFNPSTVISYQLPTANHVSMKVFDTIGGEVATLVNEVKEAGYYSVTFSAKNLASGIYFVRLQSGDGVQLKKMQLLK